jgi:hypothetical protein
VAVGKKSAVSIHAEELIPTIHRFETFSEYAGKKKIKLMEVNKGVKKSIWPILAT